MTVTQKMIFKPAGEKETNRPVVLVAVLLAMFIAAIEATIVSTAMPSIVGELGGFSLLAWVFSSYLLMQAISTPIYGKLADLYGRKPVFVIGVLIFLIGSVMCGFAPSMQWLIMFRFIQGLGAGAVQPLATTIVGDLYTLEERAKVQGYLSSVWGISSIIGPLTGGILVEYVDWAWIFWINIPIGLLAILLVWFCLHEEVERRKQDIDVLGTGLLLTATSALIILLAQGGVSWSWRSWPVAALLILSVLTGAGFIFQERRAKEPMMPLDIWKNRLIAVANLASLTSGAVMMGVATYLPSFIQGVLDHSPMVAGLTLAFMSISWSLTATLSGRLMLKVGFRPLILCGGVCLSLGALFFLFLRPQYGLVPAGIGSFLVGAGMGFSATMFIVGIQSSVGWRQRGVATASNMFMRILGTSVGTALLGGILNSRLSHYFSMHGTEPNFPLGIDTMHLLMDLERRQHFSPEMIQLMKEGLSIALNSVYWTVLLLALLSTGIIVLMPKLNREGKPEKKT